MSYPDLDKMNLKDLRKLQKDVDAAITTYEERQRQEALAALDAKAREMGFSLSELTQAGGKQGKGSIAPPKFRDPADPRRTWTGKGRRPEWFKSAISEGKTPDDLKIG